MEDGAEFRDVLAEAQARGFAESDPTEDVAGLDARAKLTILARLALGVEIEPTDVPARSIAPVSAIDFAYAQELKCTIRQISRAELRNGVWRWPRSRRCWSRDSPLLPGREERKIWWW